MMPTPTLFIIFSFLLKVVEGIGLAMFSTASLAVLTQLFSQRKGTLAVSVVAIALLMSIIHNSDKPLVLGEGVYGSYKSG